MIWLDSETFSAFDLTRVGTYKYAANCEVMLLPYALDDKPVLVPDLTEEEVPEELIERLRHSDDLIVAHNAMFDRNVIEHVLGIDTDIRRWRCSMVKAMSLGLPGSLGHLGAALGLKEDYKKIMDGKKLINRFCSPAPKNHKVYRYDKTTHPDEWTRFVDYARQDVESMRHIWYLLPEWNYSGQELDLYHLDQEINDRGFLIDMDLVHAAIRAASRCQDKLASEIDHLTRGAVTKATQRDKLLEHIAVEYGLMLAGMTKADVEEALNSTDVTEPVKKLLLIRQKASKSSTAKYEALLRAVSADNRLRGTLQYDGASRTRRWSGRTFQPQNLTRPTMKADAIEQGIEMMKADCEDLIFDNVMELASNAVRGVIVAPEGHKLVVSDLSNIEGRMNAWLSGEEWKLQAFRDFDAGEGHDLYKLAYSRAFGIRPEQVTGDQRQIGKVMELACIAENELVLTNKGLIPIEKVDLSMLVYDGNDFVKHEGVVYQGIREVIEYDGLKATADHKVWVNGQDKPIHFGEAASSGQSLQQPRPSWFKVWVARNNKPGKTLSKRLDALLRKNALCRLWQSAMDLPIQHDARQIERLSDVYAEPASYRTQMVAEKSVSDETTLHESKRQGLQKLRRAGHRISILFSKGWRYLDTRASWTATRQRTRSNRQPQTLHSREPAMGHQVAEHIEQSQGDCVASGYRMDIYGKSLQRVYHWAVTATGFIKRANNRLRESCGLSKTQELERHPTKTTRVRVYDILNAGPRRRFVVSGKLVSNCGYEGGVGAFIVMAAGYDMDLELMADVVLPTLSPRIMSEAKKAWGYANKRRATHGLSETVFVGCDSVKRLWREAHPAITAMWPAMVKAAKSAILKPGTKFQAGKVEFVMHKQWLLMRIPSGRVLCYYKAKVEDSGSLSFWGVNSKTRKFQKQYTYGGSLLENATQSASRDVLADNMPAAEEAGYQIILTVHDELITETPDADEYSVDELSAIMATNPPWAEGLPLAAAGFETKRYRKG